MIASQRPVDAVLRQDLSSFIRKSFLEVDASQPYQPNWHIDLIAHHLEKVFRRETKRLAITLPPRGLKSISTSVAFPAWALGHDPSLRVIAASYSQDLAFKHSRDCRHVMESSWYRRLFPGSRIAPSKASEGEFATTKRGFRLATSVGGTLTGRGGNLLIIDDPIKPQDALSSVKRQSVNAWFDGTLYSRLDDKRRDAIILIMQRVHGDDLFAHVTAKEDWEILCLPALATRHETFPLSDGRVFTRAPEEPLHPAREPKVVLEQARANLGAYFFEAQYQQNPVPEQGNLVRWEWFRSYTQRPGDPGLRIVQSWDTAMTAHDGSDWSVCTTWATVGADYYLLDLYRARLDFPSLKRQVLAQCERWDAHDVLIEDTGSGTGLIQQLRSERILRPIPVRPVGSKADRMAAQSAVIEAGHVLLPEQAAWIDDFQAEILAFPHGKHDDQVDSLSQFLNWAEDHRRNRATSIEFLI